MANNKITQNNIIMWLEDVVPQMQKSASPTDTLLKYAKDHNFSSAILERVGHMFNSLKTNSFYNMAKESSHRGDYISTLDVDDLIKQYEAFNPNELDLSNIKTATKSADSFGGCGKIKLASTNAKEGDINDLALLSDVETMSCDANELKYAAKKKEILNNLDSFKFSSYTIASTPEKPLFEKDPVDFEMQCKKAKQEAHFEYTKAVEIMNSIEKKFASVYNTHSLRKGHIPFANLEYKMLESAGDNYEVIKEAMDQLGSALKSHSLFLKENLKTASEAGLLDDLDFVDDGEEALLSKDVLDYSEAYQHAKEASEFIEEIEKTAANAYDPLLTLAKIDLTNKQEETEKSKKTNIDKNTEYTENKNKREDAKNKREEKEHEQNLKLRQAKFDLEQEDKKVKQKQETQKRYEDKIQKSKENTKKELEKLTDSASALLSKGLIDPTTKALENSFGHLKALYSDIAAAKAEKNQSEKLSPVEEAVKSLQDRLVLEQLLYTDPILSKLSDDETNQLMESYNTLVRRNPDLASDVGLLRPILRQIIAAGGVDINTASGVANLPFRK